MNNKLEEEKLLKKLADAGLPVLSVKMIPKEEVEKIFGKKQERMNDENQNTELSRSIRTR